MMSPVGRYTGDLWRRVCRDMDAGAFGSNGVQFSVG